MGKLGLKKILIFIVISAAVGLCMQMPYLRNAYYDQMMAALAITDGQMGILASTLGMACTICYPISGFVADRFGTKPLLCVSLFGTAACTLAYGFISNFYALVVLQVLFGVFTTVTLWSAYLAAIRGLGDESIQGKLYGWSEATRGLTQTLMGFVFIAIMAAAATPAASWRIIMITGAAVLTVCGIIAMFVLPNGKPSTSNAGGGSEKKYTIGDVLKNKGVWLVILVAGCAYASWSLGQSYITSYTTRVVGISESMASTVGVIRSYIIVVVAGIFGGWFLDKFTYKGKGFILLLSVITACYIGIMFTNAVIPLCVFLTVVLAFIANVMKSTYFSTMGQAGIPPKMTALATGVISMIIFFLPDTVLPSVCGAWLDAATAAGDVAAGFHKIFYLLIGFSLVGVVSSIALVRRTKALEASGEMERINAEAAE